MARMTEEQTQVTAQGAFEQGRIYQSEYSAYLLRLWRSSSDSTWRGSLQSVRTGERHLFADLETMFAFLIEHLAGESKP